MACDLHTHSLFSDGADTPEAILAKAVSLGLRALALTDHNSADGLPVFMAAAEGLPICAVPGVEFSTDFRGTELHILGLFLPTDAFSKVREFTDASLKRKEASNRLMVQRLRESGYDLDFDAVLAKTPKGVVNRAHISRELKERGYFPEDADLFATLLAPGGGYYDPPPRLQATEVIGFIRGLGGVAVLAHPLLTLTAAELEVFLQEAVPAGLDGMETVYVTYDKQTTETACAMAAAYGILPSGGSDYHGSVKPGVALGSGRGDLVVPDDYYEALAALAAQRQRKEG